MNYCCSCRFWLPFSLLLLIFGILLLRLNYINVINLQFFRSLRYESERNAIIQHEKSQRFGSFIHLDAAEEKANVRLMALKRWEYTNWRRNDTGINSNGDFRKMRPLIRRSLIYSILKRMPKGAALHLHEFGLANTGFLINLTYEQNLWVCAEPSKGDYELLVFSWQQPNKTENKNISCNWFLLQELRNSQGQEQVDKNLKNSFTFTLEEENTEAFQKLRKIQQLLKGLLTFSPLRQQYVVQAFREFSMDNVQHLEIRSTLPSLYDMQGKPYTIGDTLETLRNECTAASYANVNFPDSRLIYTLSRSASDKEVERRIAKAIVYKLLYPDYLIGIDLINDNPKYSRPLKEFSYKLLKLQDQLDYYLTNDEISWHDNQAHEDLLETYLLRSNRVTFHKALLYHPFILWKLYFHKIPIIINPISDQILQNITNMADHPASLLFSYNLPLVISSDYPSYWRADPLTHDFYMTFMIIAGEEADLKVLKQLALNSIYYSGLENKEDTLKLWTYQWNEWICSINDMFY